MRFLLALALVLAAACGSHTAPSSAAGPRTAAERNAADRAAEERAAADDPDAAPVAGAGKSWGGWRYQGARDDCFFVVERDCFATLAAACEATECKHGCTTRGAGPATVYCKP